MTTEVLLARLFDFQKYSQNQKLAGVITDSEGSADRIRELDDSELEIWAAGDPNRFYPTPPEKRHDD